MKRRPAVALILTAALMITRFALAPKYLFYIDNINFALAMEHFQPLLHQPHPPGYPLYVALLDILHLLVPSVRYVQLLSGTLGSLIALLAIWKLGDEIFEPPAGAFAAALLFFLPAFWLAGIGNQVRTFIAAGSVAVALCAWRATQAANGERWLLFAAAALGVAGGFRPELVILLFPLLCLAWFEGARRPSTAIATIAVLGAVTGAWLGALTWRVGGPSAFRTLLQSQWRSGTGATSMLSGAGMKQNLFTATLATYWTGIGVLPWMGAAAVAWRRIPGLIERRRLLFLTVWFAPPFLFHAVVYITDPDTALDCIPVLSILGGWILSIAVQDRPRQDAWFAGAAAVAVNIGIFFLSPLHQGRDASYAWVQLVGTETTKAIDGIAELARGRPATVILDRALVTSRQIAYYFPGVRIVVLDQGCPAPFPPGATRLIWVARFDAKPSPGPPFRLDRGLAFTDLPAGSRLKAGPCEFSN